MVARIMLAVPMIPDLVGALATTAVAGARTMGMAKAARVPAEQVTSVALLVILALRELVDMGALIIVVITDWAAVAVRAAPICLRNMAVAAAAMEAEAEAEVTTLQVVVAVVGRMADSVAVLSLVRAARVAQVVLVPIIGVERQLVCRRRQDVAAAQ